MANKPNSPTSHDVEDEAPQQSDRKGAATAASPASEPEAAHSRPASDAAVVKPRTVISSIRDPQIPFEDDPAKVLLGMKVEKASDMMRKVACHVIETFAGRTKVKDGTFTAFRFMRHEVVLLPKWFALSHPTRFVIKE